MGGGGPGGCSDEAHAFENAANLANAAGSFTAEPSGQFHEVTGGNCAGVLPTAPLNSLANVVEACVNSSGGAAADSGAACGNLFTYTTPPGGTATMALSAIWVWS